jgi:transposase-like protein
MRRGSEADEVETGSFTLEFKQEAARLVESGRIQAHAARSLGMVEQTLGN